MLRITIVDRADRIVMKLEGKLKGAFAKELERVWSELRSQNGHKALCVDLTSVSFVDYRGKGVLSGMRRENVELFAAGPLMTSVVEEIAQHQ